MNKQPQLHFWDPARWLIGENPAWFLIEVFFRGLLIYAVLHVILRLMGRRMASQMTTAELAVIVTLGAAIGVPMQVPDRGMLEGILILLIALAFQRGIALLTYRSRRAELWNVGDVVTLVEDGRILLDVMGKVVISRERLFSVLRGLGVEHLGEIRRVYVEATGDFSVYKFKEPLPGLSIMPIFDEKLRNSARTIPGYFVCFSCGERMEVKELPTCAYSICGFNHWTEAVRSVEANGANDRQTDPDRAAKHDYLTKAT